MDRSIVMYARGVILKHGTRFRPGIYLDVDGYALDVTIEDQIFETSDECQAYLISELPRIVADVCDKMGLKQIRADYYGASCQEVQ